jgi:nucleotide-binding universal stress UspA family protein
MKILVPIDGSDASMRALQYVTQHKAFSGADDMDGDGGHIVPITLIHVHLPVPGGRAKALVGQDVLAAYYDEEAEAALKAARDYLASIGYKPTVIKAVGDPGGEIARAASAFDLVVMGNKGRTALGNLVMGSVATRTLAESHVPVLLVK